MSPAPAEKRKAKVPGDMDWDDEEQNATQVMPGKDEGGSRGPRPAAGAPLQGAAAALLASSGGSAAHAASRAHLAQTLPAAAPPPASVAPVTEPSPARSARSPRHVNDEATVVRARPESGSKVGVLIAAILALGLIGAGAFWFMNRKGQLKIDIASGAGAPIARAEIFIDGQKKCDAVPCVVTDLAPGPKTIRVITPDSAPLEPQTHTISAGETTVVVFSVVTSPTAPTAAPVAAVTGLKIDGTQKNVKVFVDGAEKGTLPLELKDLTPGSHKIRLEGGDRYEKLEQTVDIAPGQVKDLGALKLKVVKGQVTLDLLTQGADVSLIRTSPKKSEKKLPASLWKNPPVKFDIDPSEGWKIVAKKKGHDDFSQDLSFDDGEAEKTVRIELTETGKAPSAVAAGSVGSDPGDKPGGSTGSTGGDKTASAGGTTKTPGGTTAAGDKGATDKPAAASGSGTLNINSIPVSKVVLDGRPLGSTPKVGVSVPAGSHTVTFIHPELGKKSVTVQVKAGETKTAAVKFK